MNFEQTHLSGSYVIKQDELIDNRGFFARYFCEAEFSNHDLNTNWVQANNSLSRDVGTVRGLHFQYPPHTEIKLVRCISGSFWDVIVDLRQGSPTYGGWFGESISAKNRWMIYVPAGFAHGTMALEPNSELLYLVSNFYRREFEGQLLWNDEDLNIDWPLKKTSISEKDARGKSLSQIEPVCVSDR